MYPLVLSVRPGDGTGRTRMLPDLEIWLAEALVDAPVSIRLNGFPAGQQVTLRAEMANYPGCTWESQATFVADRQECVDVATQRPPEPFGNPGERHSNQAKGPLADVPNRRRLHRYHAP
jgi:hypothetical protein